MDHAPDGSPSPADEGLPWPRGRTPGRPGAGAGRGFTLIELMIVSVIVGALAAVAIPRFNEVLLRAQVARAIGDMKALEVDLYDFWLENREFPESLSEVGRDAFQDPWGRPYEYQKIGGSTGGVGQFRKDRFLVPLNSDFDLYSMGADGASQAPLSAAASQDDVIRANDGGFIGLASEY